MVHASDFEPVSIRGRFAFALTCLEALADRFGLGGEYFSQLVDLHWQFTSRFPLVEKGGASWFREVNELCGGRWEDLTDRLRSENPGLSSDQLHAIRHAFEELQVIGGRDMYAQPQVWNTIGPTLNVAGILMRWGVPLPSVALFARSKWGERVSFGEPRHREFFRCSADAQPFVAAD